jgi:hypothetical protein
MEYEKLFKDVSNQFFIDDVIKGPVGTSRVVFTPETKRRMTIIVTPNGGRIRAVEQDPDRESTWALLARGGHKIIQFSDERTGIDIGNTVDGKPIIYQ